MSDSIAQQPLQAPSRSARLGNPEETLTLKGVMFVGKEAFASLSYGRISLSSWAAVNDDFLGYTVKYIGEKHVLLSDPATGKEYRITLAGSSIKPPSDDQSGPKPYTKAWINSEANPMLRTMESLPFELYRNWAKLTDKERADVVEFYRKHGWRIVLAETIGETTNFAWENIYEAERIAVVKANAETFQKSLTPDQLRVWAQLRGGGEIRAVGGKFTPEQEKKISEIRQLKASFDATLSPSQMELLKGIRDFTKANWND